MTLYYFHFRTAADVELHDERGRHLPDDFAAEQMAVQSVLELTWNNRASWRGCSLEVCREKEHLVTVFFDEILARNRRASAVADRCFCEPDLDLVH